MTSTSTKNQRRFFSPLFIASAVLLLVAGLGIRPAISALTKRYSKEPIDLRLSFDDFDPTQLPSFRWLPEVRGIETTLEEIETEDWFSYIYRRRTPLQGEPDLDSMIFVTYYSDPRAQIPHTPEVCYRQGGAVVRSMRQVTVPTPDLAPEIQQIEALMLHLEQGNILRILVYVLVCEGKCYPSRGDARIAIGWPGNRYTYFSKVEASTYCPPGTDPLVMEERCKLLLSETLTPLLKYHYPDLDTVRGK